MGEYAEMMMDGTCCQICGEYLGAPGDGFSQTCGGCANVAGHEHGLSKKSKKQRNKEWSTNHLIELGIKFTSHNSGLHLKVYRPVGLINFWPSTGKYKRIDGSYGRGVKNMINETEK